jgi:hypothetical protein
LIGFRRCRIWRRNIVDFFFEPSERFANPFTDLRELSRSENDEDNDEDNNEFRDPHGTEHGVIPFPEVPTNRVGSARLRIESTL